jgi:GTP-binding protein
VRDAQAIVGELGKFSEDLLAKPRWLVLNKSDLLPEEEARAKAIGIAQKLKYRGPAFLISGVSGQGTRDLTEAVMRFLETAEAPAQGNLPLPVVVAKVKAAVKKSATAKKPAAKKTVKAPKTKAKATKAKAKAKPKAKAAKKAAAKPKAKAKPNKKQKQKTRR